MQKDMILKSSLLDILFEHKNKNYGAYVLRKSYPIRLQKALAVTILLSVSIILLLSSFKEKQKLANKPPIINGGILASPIPIKPVEKPKEKPKVKVNNAPVKKAPIFTSKLQLLDNPPQITVPKPNVDGSANGNTDNPNATNSGFGGTGTGINIPKDTVTKVPDLIVTEEITVNTVDIQTIVDVDASYPGGTRALAAYLQDKLGKEAIEDGETKKITIHFVVETDGSLTAIKANETDDANFSIKTERAFAKMKKWNPAKIKNIAVRTYLEIPVTILAGEE